MKVTAPPDLLRWYAWMERTVDGLFDQSIPTVHRPPYGVKEQVRLKLGPGFTTVVARPLPVPTRIGQADHTLIFGGVRWVTGTNTRAVFLDRAIRPLEEQVYATTREDKSPIVIRITTDGWVHVPTGNTEDVNLYLRYPTPLGGG